jgi:hypothetical protein
MIQREEDGRAMVNRGKWMLKMNSFQHDHIRTLVEGKNFPDGNDLTDLMFPSIGKADLRLTDGCGKTKAYKGGI